MIKYALMVSFVIATLVVSGGLACSADHEETGQQEVGKKELQMKKPAQKTRAFEEREPVLEGDFFGELERFLESQLPVRWEEWRHPRYWRRPLLGAVYYRQTLRVDVLEKDNEFLIKAELPGVDKKDIHITISDNMVTIEADASKEEEEEKGDYYRREISSGAYSRTLMLPAQVKEDEAKASFEGGVLELTIPKREKTKSTTVEIK